MATNVKTTTRNPTAAKRTMGNGSAAKPMIVAKAAAKLPAGVKAEQFVRYTFNTSPNGDAKRAKQWVPVTVAFNFAGVSMSALQNVALRSFAIEIQNAMRAATKGKNARPWNTVVNEINESVVNVAERLSKPRKQRQTPVAKMVKASGGASAEQLQAVIAELQRQLAAK